MTDEVISAGYDLKQSEARITSFREFMETNKDELIACKSCIISPTPSGF